jgi:hypothetical protein
VIFLACLNYYSNACLCSSELYVTLTNPCLHFLR